MAWFKNLDYKNVLKPIFHNQILEIVDILNTAYVHRNVKL